MHSIGTIWNFCLKHKNKFVPMAPGVVNADNIVERASPANSNVANGCNAEFTFLLLKAINSIYM
jgi:hypothetical protein